MEVWALEGPRRRLHPPGDAHRQVRRHCRPRQGLRESIVKGENIREPSIPESFKVLLEIQSLRSTRTWSPRRATEEIGEEEDTFRAAEELGIELSGVRDGGNGADATDEKEEQVAAEGDGRTEDAEEAASKWIDINNFDAIEIGLPCKKIRGWSSGEVTKPETINYRIARAGEGRPVLRAHLRSDQGLGVHVHKRVRYKGIVCAAPRQVEVTRSGRSAASAWATSTSPPRSPTSACWASQAGSAT